MSFGATQVCVISQSWHHFLFSWHNFLEEWTFNIDRFDKWYLCWCEKCIWRVLWVSILAWVPSDDIERVRFCIYTATSHKGATKISLFFLLELPYQYMSMVCELWLWHATKGRWLHTEVQWFITGPHMVFVTVNTYLEVAKMKDWCTCCVVRLNVTALFISRASQFPQRTTRLLLH